VTVDDFAAPLPGARLTVAAVARRLGVAPATLRTWDRRYGLGPSEHQSGAHRRYTASDLVRLETMRRLVLDGVVPAEAAQLALARPVEPEAAPAPAPVESSAGAGGSTGPELLGSGGPTGSRSVDTGGPDGPRLVDELAPVRTRADTPAPGEDDSEGASEPEPARRRGGPGGRVLALPGADGVVRGIGRAAMALDAPALTAQVRSCLQQRGVLATWDDVLRPVLVAVGARWAATGDGVEVEHLLSDCLAVALRERAAAVVPAAGRGRPVLAACAPGELHALPLHALGAGLAERGIAVRTLGPAMPAHALASAVRRTGPAALFVWSQLPGTADPAVLAGLPVTRPPTAVVVGGPGWEPSRLPTRVRLAGDLREALALVERAVRG
jgi:MerR family transcriptional regulator, light-induced transcriptional regulator